MRPVLGYFVAISTLCITHLRSHPELWFTSIYSIVWFANGSDVVEPGRRRSSAPQIPPLEDSDPARLSVVSRRHSTSSLPRDVENQLSVNPDLDKPLPSLAQSNTWWGRLLPGRAGKDHPFGFRRTKGPEYKWWVSGENREENEGSNDQAVGDNDPPKYPGSQPPTPTPGPQAEPGSGAGESQFLPHPPIPLDEDEPIPVDNRSEWVRAESALGS